MIIVLTLFYSQVSAQTNINEALKNTSWKLDFYTINDSQVLNSANRFYIFKDSLYFWLETQKGFTDADKDTSLLSMGLWQIDTADLLVMHEHYLAGFWYETAIRSHGIKLGSIIPDAIGGVPLVKPNMKIRLVKVNQINYQIPKYQLVRNPSSTYNLAYQTYVRLPKQKLIVKSELRKKRMLFMEDASIGIELQDTFNHTNTYIYGTFFTCDSFNLYVKVDSKNFNIYYENGITTHYQTYLPWQPDTTTYPFLGLQLFEAVSYANVSRITTYSKPDLEPVFITLLTTSFISSLVAAPVLSYNYKTGNFNQKRYYKILVPSLITFGVTIPLFALNNALTRNSFSYNKDAFYFEQIKP